MNTVEVIEKSLEVLREEYNKKIESLADRIFQHHLKKYFQENNIAMRSATGWGAIFYHHNIPNGKIEIWDFPEDIQKIMTIEVDGYYFICDYMNDFTPEEE